VVLLLFPGQCAETTAAKQLLLLLAKTMIFVRDKGFDSDEIRHLIENTAAWPAYRLVQIKPAIDGAIRSFIGSDTWWKTSFSASSIGAASRPATRISPHPSSLSQHFRPQSIKSDAFKSTRSNLDFI
jgi:hypothetical protein